MADAGDERATERPLAAEAEQEQEIQEAERSLGLVGESQQSQEPTQSQEKRAEVEDRPLTDNEDGEEEKEEKAEEAPAQLAEPLQEQQEEPQELEVPVDQQQQQQQQQEEIAEEKTEEEAPRFNPPSPPREQPVVKTQTTPAAPTPAPKRTPTAATPSRSSRYTYAELKEAQRRCEAKMVETALLECSESSKPQKEIFRAHVTDLCANVFAAALRKYNPDSKEDVEPIDTAIAAKVAEMERKLKAKEASIAALRKEVPQLAAVATRLQLANERKRSADVLVTTAEASKDVEIEDAEVEALRDAYVKTSTTIASANTKLAQVVTHTTETIHVVEQAMKRPKTAIDKAMELSPLKTTVLLDDHEIARDTHPSTMRTRLAMHLSASKSL